MKIKPWVVAMMGLAAMVALSLFLRITGEAQQQDAAVLQDTHRLNQIKALSLSGRAPNAAPEGDDTIPAQNMAGKSVQLSVKTQIRIVSLDLYIATVRLDKPGGAVYRVGKENLAWHDGNRWKPAYFPTLEGPPLLRIQ